MKKLIKKIGISLALLPSSVLAVDVNTFSDVGMIDKTLTPEQIIVNIINFILKFGAALAVLFIIIGGVMYITAGGNDDKTKLARKYIFSAVIGLIILILAIVIVNFVDARIRNDIIK